MDERFKYLTEIVIPKVVGKLDFNNPELTIEIKANAFFSSSKNAQKHLAESYSLVLEELKDESKQKINILTAEKKAISDNLDFLMFSSIDGNTSTAQAHLRNELDKVDSKLIEETNEYRLIESVEWYINILKERSYRI